MTAPPASAPQAVPVAAALRPIFDAFLDIQRRHLAQLETALAARDTATLARLAHSVKGACATYQLPEAAAIALALEKSLANADFDAAGRRLAELTRYLQAVTVTFVETPPAAAKIAPARKSP